MPEYTPAPPDTRTDEIRAELQRGLSLPQKELPPKYFYDQRGSELFEEITHLPEYYPTRVERSLLVEEMPQLIDTLRPATLIELGAGSSRKTRVVLDAMIATCGKGRYVPVDISEEYMAESAVGLRAEYPTLDVTPLVADLAQLTMPRDLPRPALFAFLGSTIGNLSTEEAANLLRRVHAAMEPGDRFLLGVDLRKNPAVLEAAYNDSRGITAEFNLNMLRVLNAQTDADFDLEGFEHRAFYDAEKHRIEMHLVSLRPQTVTIPDVGRFSFRQGETLRTEISAKHDRSSVRELFELGGMKLEMWATDPDGLYALALAAP
jgi:L-histidine N-alpha-methyltransferase